MTKRRRVQKNLATVVRQILKPSDSIATKSDVAKSDNAIRFRRSPHFSANNKSNGVKVFYGPEEVLEEIPLVINYSDCEKIIKAFSNKATERLKLFLSESRKSAEKLKAIFAKLEEAGYNIKTFTLDQNSAAALSNSRRRPREVIFRISAQKEKLKLEGLLRIKPCSIRLLLATSEIEFPEPVVYCCYFKNFIFRENYLAALVHGKEATKNDAGWKTAADFII